MEDSDNFYNELHVRSSATTAEIKQAYRRLAKIFHPDSNSETADHDKIVQINAAYEVLSDPHRRHSYDQQLRRPQPQKPPRNRQQRTADAQEHYQRYRRTARDADVHLEDWIQQVYVPVTRLLSRILNSLDAQIDELSADPFDDELMENFQAYLEDCRDYLNQAQLTFRSFPNPATVAGAAASLYYCLNQLSDGIEELQLFTLNYDDYYLHTGQELFRIAAGLHYEAREAVKDRS
jgi:molecular chaperone DnaJ